jgi:hypothetical protein
MASTSRTFVLAGSALFVPAFLAFGAIAMWIRTDARRISADAVSRFEGDRVHALISLVECDTCSLSARNRAVWALGRLQADAALPSLLARFDGQKCDHATRLCQHELQKAIHMIETRNRPLGVVWHVLGP